MNTLYIGNNRLLSQTGYGGRLLIPSEDLSLAPELIFTGGLELPLTRYFQNNLRDGHRVLDIGANIGYFSVLIGMLIGPSGKLWAYEPHPRLFAFLMDNLSINYLRDRAEVSAKAVYSARAELPFHASQRYMGNSSIHKPNDFYHRHYTDEFQTIKVETEVLNRRAEEFGILDFVKIDIEGGEYHAMLGMEKLIQDRIRNLVFEVNRNMLAEDWEPFCSLLRKFRDHYGKRFSLLSPEGVPVPVDLEQLLAREGYPYALME
jgi:FkbM family methyltransferase